MPPKISKTSKKKGGARPAEGGAHDKLMSSRQRLLDLTLRNRLLSFRPGNPDYKDDGKAHKHVVAKGQFETVWEKLVEKQGKIEIHALSQDQKQEIARELQLEPKPGAKREATGAELALSASAEHWADIEGLRSLELSLKRGNLISLLPEEVFQKRIKKIRHEQDTLINSTGDSALFLAVGFLEWYEADSHPRSGEPFFAPLVLVHVNLSQQSPDGGGQCTFHLAMDADQPQGNPCLAEKFRQDFSIVLPELEDDEHAEDYLTRFASAIRKQKKWKIHRAVTLGFFNFARYRLWLDLDPGVWPEGEGPADHNIVEAILSGTPLPQPGGVPDDETVAEHQATQDLPLVMDSDSTQYAAMLGALNRGSLVIQGPPGSGKSQTITNLIAIAMAQKLKVLFVAQKLPALQVVQRRLETVGLGSFCLPLFSDKARATSVHEHLKIRSKLSTHDYTRSLQSSVPAIANNLNGHATLLRSKPAGFSESVSQLIQRATAMQLWLAEEWGEKWSEELLEVDVPDAEPSGSWWDAREKSLHQWHRLKAEAGTAWTNWAPIKLGELEAPKAATVVHHQAEVAALLEGDLGKLPPEFHDLTLLVLEQLLAQLAEKRFVSLQEVVPSLLNYLWAAPENSALVARLERDIEEFYRQLAQAQTCLRFTAENRGHVAETTTAALKVIAASLTPRCTLDEATQSLVGLSEVCRIAEDLVAMINSYRSGTFALLPDAQSTPSSIEPTWSHVDLFARHSHAPEFCVHPSIKLRLAAHVLEDVERYDQAVELGQRLEVFHLATSRLKTRVGNLPRLKEATNREPLSAAVKLFISRGLEAVALKDGDSLQSALKELESVLTRLEQVNLADLAQAVFNKAALSVRDYLLIAALEQVRPEQLVLPSRDIRSLLLKLPIATGPEQVLRGIAGALKSHKQCFEELRPAFPWLEFGRSPELEQHNAQQRIEAISTALGLAKLPVSKLPELLEAVCKLKGALGTAMESTTALLAKWPFNPPDTLQQLRDVRSVFILLGKCPQVANTDLAIALANPTTFASFELALEEADALRAFQEELKTVVAFRDLPEPTVLAEIRRLLRPYVGSWTRWFAGDYRKARAMVRAFLLKPMSAGDLVTLLDQLETHELKRREFSTSSIAETLGKAFNGLETNWKVFDPLLTWLTEVRQLSSFAEITEFVHTAVNDPAKLGATIKQLELLEQQFETGQPIYSALEPLQQVLAGEAPVHIGGLRLMLARWVEELTWLVEATAPTLRELPNCSVGELVEKVRKLEQLKLSVLELNKYDSFLAGSEGARVSPTLLLEAADWFEALRDLSPELIACILREDLNLSQHQPLIGLASEYRKLSSAFCARFGVAEANFLTGDADLRAVKKEVGELINAAPGCIETASTCRLESDLTFRAIQELLSDLDEVEQAGDYFAAWKQVLFEEPSNLTAGEVEGTLKWLLDLRAKGAAGAFLAWLLAEETDSRLTWWQGVVPRCKALQQRVRGLQENFSVKLDEDQVSTSLVSWISAVADRNAKTLSAIEAVEAFSQSNPCPIHELTQAAGNLSRALALAEAMEDWRERLGVAPTSLTHQQVQAHRQWIIAVRSGSPVLGQWLVEADTTARCELLLGLKARLAEVQAAVKQTSELLADFGRCTGKGPFGVLDQTPTPAIIQARCAEFSSNLPTLPVFAAMLREEQAARKFGLKNILNLASKVEVSTDLLLETFRGAVVYQQAKAIWEVNDQLKTFQSSEHERLRGRFQEQDQRQQGTNRRYIASMLATIEVTEGSRGRTPGEHTQFALLQHEMGKKRRHLPIRKLVERAGAAIQDLCPCWMMTPTSVAQFLPPGKIAFDMVIMDEASQLNPEDAWGAIARGSQLVVVGDHKQMPPSDFFTSALEEDESMDDDDEIDGGKSESILVAAMSALWSSTLQWHYRSRHETLIAPANFFSYDNSLVLFPNPHREHPDLGIGYHYVQGTTTTGKVTNAIEAEAIVNHIRDLVLREYAKPPKDRRSIGIVTMNLPQQDCVIDLLTRVRNEDRKFDLALASLEADDNEEPFFVRNLENIQGDERDIMVISCTYGPQQVGGTPTQRFGPLNREGGERRFNVLITRSKCRMEVFASIRSDQIVVSDEKRQGLRDFHLFLKYCESGVLMEAGQSTGRGPDSPFEIQVEAVLTREGYQVELQVGVAGYFIDMAVRHPKTPGLFAIGIECDGYTYHSSRAARDRDRLREGVLKDRGWKLHRIWSTDWFVNPEQAKANLLKAVAAACR